MRSWIEAVGRMDEAVEARVAERRSGPIDALAHLLSSAADRSKLWLGIAGLRLVRDRRNGRRATVRMIAAVGLQSLVVETGVKRLTRRARPVNDVRLRFLTRRPPSTSFPSGHAASAATAAVLLADGMEGWGPPLALLAIGVGWSRVQTGLHHLSDVAGGLAVGTVVGLCVKRLIPLDSGGAHD